MWILVVLLASLTAALWETAAATLVWDANNDSPAGYRVWVTRSGEAAPTVVDVGTNTSYSLSGYGSGFYSLAVTAYAASGLESDQSVSIPWTPDTAPAPTIGAHNALRDGTNWILQVQWAAPSPRYEVNGYWWRTVQGGVTNSPNFTTNQQVQVTVPFVSPTFVHLWATNYNGLGALMVVPFSKPGNPKNVRKVVP